jgi:hypothetical protein
VMRADSGVGEGVNVEVGVSVGGSDVDVLASTSVAVDGMRVDVEGTGVKGSCAAALVAQAVIADRSSAVGMIRRDGWGIDTYVGSIG